MSKNDSKTFFHNFFENFFESHCAKKPKMAFYARKTFCFCKKNQKGALMLRKHQKESHLVPKRPFGLHPSRTCWTVCMLHPCMLSNFLINIENTESTHREILLAHNAAFTISTKTENISTSSL